VFPEVLVQRRKTGIAQVYPEESFTNQNINPIYEGMEQFDNPLFDQTELDATFNDGFAEPIEERPAA
jgi:hypothetical protein